MTTQETTSDPFAGSLCWFPTPLLVPLLVPFAGSRSFAPPCIRRYVRIWIGVRHTLGCYENPTPRNDPAGLRCWGYVRLSFFMDCQITLR